jgi:hypothetical protein
VAAALLAPWTLHRRARDLSFSSAAAIAVVSILLAAGLSTMLSTWTYLAGKGLLLTQYNEMDLGQDDLPPDSVRQVAMGFGGSLAMWICLLLVVLLVCAVVADALYVDDRAAFRLAIRSGSVASVWFVVWAVLVLALNSLHQDEIRRPTAAIRAYAQLNQKGYRGSSAMAPGPPEREPLAARGRFLPLVVVFPVIWSVGLPRSRAAGRQRPRWLLIGAAIGLSWVAWGAVWRILPWIRIGALAG